MKRLLSTFGQTSCLLLKQHETSSFGIWLVVAILSMRKGYTLNKPKVNVLPFRIDLFRVVAVLLVGMLALAKGSYAQTCNIVTNGTFTGGSSTGWTNSSGGWVFQTSPAVRAFNNTDGASNQDLTQTLTGLNGGPVAHQVTVSFDLIMQQAGQNSTAITQASLQVLLNGVVYATFNNPTPTGAATGKVTVTTANSASISGFDNLQFPGGTTGNVITDAGISIVIPWPTGSPNSAALTFRFNAPYSDNSGNTVGSPGNGQGGDDFGLQNVLTSGNAAQAPTVSTTTIGVSCSSSTANLNSLLTSTSTGIVWYTGSDHTGTAYATPTAAVEGIYYGFYNNVGCFTPPVAVSAIAGNCADTDGDGILDLTDLDDDNDGILDTVETCVSVEASKTGVTAGMTLNAGTGTIANLLNGSEVNDFWYTGNQAIANQTVAEFDFPAPIVLTAFEITTSGVSFLTTTATVKIQGWNGTAWVDIVASLTTGTPSASTYSTSSSVKFPFAANTTAYTKYRAFGISGTTNSSPFVREAYFTSPCNNDLDGDGLANNVDLDADGDGCSDAIEGGAPFFLTNLVSSTIAGGNSGTGYTGTSNSPVTQNLGIAVGSTGIPTIAGTGQAIGSSQNKLQNTACVDSDSDNVPNDIDLDDDNDGILDTIESTTATNGGDGQITYKKWNFTELASSNSFYSSTTQHLNSPVGTLKYGDFPDYTASAANASGTTAVVFGQLPWVDIPNGGSNPSDGNFTQIEGFINLPCYSNTLAVRTLANGTPAIAGGVRETLTTLHLALDASGFPTLNTTDLQQVSYQKVDFNGDIVNSTEYTFTNSTSGGKWIRFGDAISDGADFYGALIQWNIDGAGWVNIPAAAFSSTATGLLSVCNYTDNDSDGIPNYLDLDSDGDGCSDAIEGGAAFTVATLVTSSMPGGNSGTGYTGTSGNPVTQNLGTTVSSATATMGVPTIAGVGQTVGTSDNKASLDPSCATPCNATVAPALSATTKANSCPATTVDLSTITASNTPANTVLTWHSGTPATGANKLSSVTSLTAGTYYAAFFDATATCYSGTAVTTVTATTIACCTTPSVGGTASYAGSLLCGPTNAGTITLTGQTGNVVKWQTSIDGGTNWTDITGTSTSLAFTNAVNNQQYRAVVNSGAGCVDANSAPATVSANAIPATPTVSVTTQPTCSVATGTFTIGNYSAANTYTFSPSAGVSQSGATVTAPAGTYTIQATANGCSSVVSTGVTINAQPVAPATPTASVTTQPTCLVVTGTFTISNYSAANTYTFSPSAGVSQSGATVTAPAGTYTVQATANGCTSAVSTGVTINAQPVAPATPTASVTTQPTCSVATGTFTIGNYSASNAYTVSPSAGVSQSGATVTAPAGTYTVQATANGCTSAASTAVTLNAPPAAPATPTVSVTTQPTCSVATGTFTISNYSAANTYTFSPSAGVSQSGATVTAPAGTYTVQATANGCSSVASTGVTINAQPVAAACCSATLAPALSTTTKANVCPATTVDLSTITATNASASVTLTWHSGTPATGTNKLSSVTSLTAGTYYAAFFDATANCYSGTAVTPVTATTVACCASPSVGGTATYAGGPLCPTSNGGTVTLAGQSGTVVKWQTSFDGGTNWIDIASTTGAKYYTFYNAVNNQQFRAVVNSDTGCVDATSSPATISTSNAACSSPTCDKTQGTVVFGATPAVSGANFSSVMVLTSTLGVIQNVSAPGSTTLTSVVSGNYFVYQVTYDNTVTPLPTITTGLNLSAIGGSCVAVSNQLAIKVCPALLPPVATPDIANTNVNTPVSGNVLTNDTDPNGGVLTASLLNQPTSGTVTMSPDGSYTYTPPTGFTGVVSFCYSETNTAGLSATACVTVNVLPAPSPLVNNAPIANNDQTQTTAGVSVTVAVVANDTDPDESTTLNGQLSNPAIVSQPSVGVAVVNTNDGTIIYTPPANFTGVVTFPYQVCDKATTPLCTTALVTVDVQPTPPVGTTLSPVAVDDALLTSVNTPKTGNVSTNDSDPNSPALSLSFVTGQPASGTVVMSPTGSYTYTPPAGFAGPTSFTYSACNTAGKCDVATVSINVQVPANLPPVVVGEPIVTSPGKPVTVCLPIIDGDLTDTHLVTVCGQPGTGTVTASVNNSSHQVCLTYTPTPTFTGSTTTCITVCDAAGSCTTVILPITVTPTSQTVALPQPPVVVVVPVVTPKDSTAQVCMTIADPNIGDVQSVTVCSSPTKGSVTATVNNTTHQVCLTYKPTPGSVGPDAICLIVCDQTGLCTQVTVPVTIVDPTPPGTTPVAPVVTPTPIVVTVGQTITVCTGITDNVGDTQTATICGQPVSGVAQVAVNNVTHALCVTYMAGSVPASTTVCIQVCDQGGLCTTVILPITVLPAPKALLLPHVWLQGALFGVTSPTGIMRDDLRVKNLIPATSPYSSWTAITAVGPISNTATVFGVTGNDAIVDWVFVELRSPSNFSAIVDSRPALVQRDGDIVEIDGISPVAFNASQGSYYVSVKHRNHLGVMTATAIPLSVTGTSVDFRTAATPTYRITTSAINQAQVTVAQGVALWAGNVVYDKSVIYQGTTNDVSAIANQVKGPQNIAGNASYILNGYFTGDVNLDGRTIYQGTSNDVNYIYLNVTKNHPGNTAGQNFFVIREQLP